MPWVYFVKYYDFASSVQSEKASVYLSDFIKLTFLLVLLKESFANILKVFGMISFDEISSGREVCNFIKKRIQHKGFHVDMAKFLRKPILNNICEQLLLNLSFTRIMPLVSLNHRYSDVFRGFGKRQWHGMG